jgi:hypothetical protein
MYNPDNKNYIQILFSKENIYDMKFKMEQIYHQLTKKIDNLKDKKGQKKWKLKFLNNLGFENHEIFSKTTDIYILDISTKILTSFILLFLTITNDSSSGKFNQERNEQYINFFHSNLTQEKSDQFIGFFFELLVSIL